MFDGGLFGGDFMLLGYEICFYWDYCVFLVYYWLSQCLFFLAEVLFVVIDRTIAMLPYSRVVGMLFAIVFVVMVAYLLIQRKYVSRSLNLINIGT